MSVGYAFLLSNGATSPWHKTRDLVDEPRYRDVWDGNTGLKVVAILKAREKPDWLRVLHRLPLDGRWHPVEMEPGTWQAVRADGDANRMTYSYDVAEYVNQQGCGERRAVTFEWRAICVHRCARLNAGRAQMRFDNVRNFTWRGDVALLVESRPSNDRYGAGDDEFPRAVS